MVDNTQITSGSGDTVRDIDRSLNAVPISAKTQVVQIDAGGQGGEQLVSGNSPLPVSDPYTKLTATLQYKILLAQQAGPNGFVPMEIPAFLLG